MRTPPPPADPGHPLQGTVLFIEDDPVTATLVSSLLARHPGVRQVHAPDGLTGVRLARTERPDFVLLDMRLPDISGLDVVRQLSGDIAGRGLRVTILSAESLSMDIIKAMSLGAFEYWVKPLSARVLDEGLRRALTGTRADPAHTLGLMRSA